MSAQVNALIDEAVGHLRLTTISGKTYFAHPLKYVTGEWAKGIAALKEAETLALSVTIHQVDPNTLEAVVVTGKVVIEQAIGELRQTRISGKSYFATPGPGHWQNAMKLLNSVKGVTPPPPPPPPPPQTAVAITSPLAGATLKGVVTVAAMVRTTVAKCYLKLDGHGVTGSSDYAAPFTFVLDTTTIPDGAHTIQVVAEDAQAVRTYSELVPITVANGTTPPPPPPPPPAPSDLVGWNKWITGYGKEPGTGPLRVPVLTTIPKLIGSEVSSLGGAKESGGQFYRSGLDKPYLVEQPGERPEKSWGGLGGYTHGTQGQPTPNEIPDHFAFVQINKVLIGSGNRQPWGSGSDGDSTTNTSDPDRPDITNLNMKSIHIEMSRHMGTIQRSDGTIMGPFMENYPACTVWPAPGTLVDVQGFVRWDELHFNSGGHLYSGWELHPITAWRLHK